DAGGLIQRTDHDVARQHRGDRRLGGERLVRQRGAAGAEDDLGRDVDVELGLEGGPEVDLGEDAKPLLPQRGAHRLDGGVVGLVEVSGDRVAGHQALRSCSARAATSRSRTAVISCSRPAAGIAPGWEKTSTPSLNAIRVGIEVICAAAASPCSASVSTLANTMSACCSDACSKIGANIRHGPHQDAQKSTRTMSLSLMVRSKFSAPRSMVAMRP